jgi:hypothetical protein
MARFREAAHKLEDYGRRGSSILLNHHFGSFDYGRDRVTVLQLQFLGTAAGNGAFDEIVTDSHGHVGHDITQLNFFDLSTQFVSG